jgi:AAA family ATP:ADP antiporter
MNIIFGLIFAVLTLVVMPHKELFRLGIPLYTDVMILIDRWYISLYYVAAEMWSSIMLNMLCWGVIIEITKLKDSKRLYGLFSLAGNIGTYVAGLWGSSTVRAQVRYFYGPNPTWEQSLVFQMIVLWAVQALIMLAFWAAMRLQHEEQQAQLQKKVKVGFWESIKIAWENPIVRNVSIMMVCFNIVYHIIDVVHNDYVRHLFIGATASMNSYLNLVSKYLGIFSIVFSWILSGSFVRVFGVPASLYFTPVLWFFLSGLDLLGSNGFISEIGFVWEGLTVPLHILSLSLILSVGRAAKFTIFDTAKEMSLLSLSVQEKRLGKASIDGITTRLGKSGGAWLVILLTSLAGGVSGAIELLQGTIFLSYFLWFISVFFLIKCLPLEATATQEEPHQ